MPQSRLRVTVILSSLALLAVVLSHHVVYYLAHGAAIGSNGAPQEPGHEQYWSGLAVLVLISLAALSGLAARQLRRLSSLAKSLQSSPLVVTDAGRIAYLRIVRFMWWRIALVAIAAFVVQENAELVASGGAAPFLDVFTRDSALALPALILVTLVVAAIAALVGWRRDALLARLRGVPARRRHTSLVIRQPGTQDRPRFFLEVLATGVRAPPAAV
jgi:hypothetical protein